MDVILICRPIKRVPSTNWALPAGVSQISHFASALQCSDAASGFPACLCALRPILCHQEPAVNLISWWRLRRQLPVLLLERRWSVDIAMVTGQTLHHRAAFVCESQSLGSALWEMSKVRTVLRANAHVNQSRSTCLTCFLALLWQ